MIVERPTLERRVAASLEAGRIPVLLGGCGSGRTSLLLRIEHALGRDKAQYLDMAGSATTPERCCAAIVEASRLQPSEPMPAADGTRESFVALLDFFDRTGGSHDATFLLDEFDDLLDRLYGARRFRPFELPKGP